MEGWMDRERKQRREGRMNGWMERQMNVPHYALVLCNGWTDKQTDRWTEWVDDRAFSLRDAHIFLVHRNI